MDTTEDQNQSEEAVVEAVGKKRRVTGVSSLKTDNIGGMLLDVASMSTPVEDRNSRRNIGTESNLGFDRESPILPALSLTNRAVTTREPGYWHLRAERDRNRSMALRVDEDMDDHCKTAEDTDERPVQQICLEDTDVVMVTVSVDETSDMKAENNDSEMKHVDEFVLATMCVGVVFAVAKFIANDNDESDHRNRSFRVIIDHLKRSLDGHLRDF